MTEKLSRRYLLWCGAVAGVAALAGCSALPTSESTPSGERNEPAETVAQADGDTEDGFPEAVREDAKEVGTRVQESVVELSFAGGTGGGTGWVISLGSFLRDEEGIDWLLTDAPTNNGNSGLPLVTLGGEVVGCVSGGTTVGERPEPAVRSEQVFEGFPDPETAVTANSVETVEESVEEWR